MSEDLQTVAQGVVDTDEAAYRVLHRQYCMLFKQIADEVAKPMMAVQARLIEAMLRENHPEWPELTVKPRVIVRGDTLILCAEILFGANFLGFSERAELDAEVMAYLERIG